MVSALQNFDNTTPEAKVRPHWLFVTKKKGNMDIAAVSCVAVAQPLDFISLRNFTVYCAD